MRKVARAVLAVGMALPFGLMPLGFFASPAQSASSKPVCKTLSGSATFSPALPKLSSSAKVKPTVTIKDGKLGGCSGGGVTSGSLVATFKFGIASNCSTLATGANTNTKGTVTIVWNTKKTSTIGATLKALSGKPTTEMVSGSVSGGLFKGSKLSVTTMFFAPKSGCTSSGLSKVTFNQVTVLKIS